MHRLAAVNEVSAMKLDTTKRLLTGLSILSTTLFVLAAPAQAVEPTIQTQVFHDSMSIPCNGFNALFEDDVTLRITTFYDSEGNPDRFLAHLSISGTITHSVTGVSFKDEAQVITSGDLPLEENFETAQGVFLNVNVPGKGVVSLAVGRITRDADPGTILTFVSGQGLEELNEQDLAFVCEGLASL
jgi:hypothetical protein